MEPISNLKIKNQKSKLQIKTKNLDPDDYEASSILYHNIFDYPLTQGELIKWEAGHKVINHRPLTINHQNGFYFLKGREGLVYKRLLRQRISRKKLLIAKSAAKILRFIPTVKMVAVTGALAMGNATDESDIDLAIITKKNSLWLTRLCVYFTLYAIRYKLRKPADGNQRDALCLNMWLDESALAWAKKDRNIYTAHEIAQIIPIINKDNTYEKFVWRNRWVLSYWPSAVRIQKSKFKNQKYNLKFKIFEIFAYKFQHWYMRKKITREVVTPTRAIFHPHDWGKVVLSRLSP